MVKKRGMEMAITTVIMIVLSIAVLTTLIVFFNSQTGFLSRWTRSQQTESNVDSIVSVCDNLVTSNSVYAYCCESKNVIFGGNKSKNIRLTCNNISREDWAGGRVREMECAMVDCV